jgi:hypothetical protein
VLLVKDKREFNMTSFGKTKRALTTVAITIMAGLLLFIILSVPAQAQDRDGTKPLFATCQVEQRYDGIWWNSCPRGSLVEAVDGRSNPPFLSLRVRCVKLVITCQDPITRNPIRVLPIDMDQKEEL